MEEAVDGLVDHDLDAVDGRRTRLDFIRPQAYAGAYAPAPCRVCRSGVLARVLVGDLSSLASASPPDPWRARGVCDSADFDGVVCLIIAQVGFARVTATAAAAAAVPAPPRVSRPLRR